MSDEDYHGLLGIYAEADRIRRGLFYSETARLSAIALGVCIVLLVLFALVAGV